MTECSAKNINFSCAGCDEAYCVDCSKADSSRKFCSKKCELECAEQQNDMRLTRHADAAGRARDMQMTGRGF
jgi:hypothetical protein